MSWSDEDKFEALAYRAELRRARECQCPGEMLGVCPGPAFCPMQEDRSEAEEE